MRDFLKSKKGKICAGVLAVLLVALTVFLATHTFVDGRAYANNARLLDLQGKSVTPEHYEAVREVFPDIEILWDVPFQGGLLASTCPEVEVSSLSDEDVTLLGYLPYLKTVDARNCTDYPQLEALVAARPEVKVLYNVTIDGMAYPQDAKALRLVGFTEQELALVRYLPCLEAVDATGCEEYDLLKQLWEAYPALNMTYQVPIGGREYAENTRELHLSDVETEELLQMLQYLPELKSVTVLDPRYSDISMTDVAETYSDVHFWWEMDVFGLHMTCQDTEVNLNKRTLESVEAVERALANFPNLERAYLGRCGLDNEELAAYRDRVRPEYKVVWNILIGALFVDTDETWFMPGKYDKGLIEEQAKLLKYCEDMICIDVGHKPLETCEFVRYMPNLKYLILADTNIEDITPLETCKNLVFLELFMSFVKDYTPLLGCTALEDLNIAYTWGDPEPIKQMTWLKRLWWNCQEELGPELSAALPNTELMLLSHPDAVAYGWRLGKRYYEQRDIMGVPYM
jgi:Leucine-rich repeat (LRR) protein